MNIERLPALSVANVSSVVYAVIRREQGSLCIAVLDNQLKLKEVIITLVGSHASILERKEDRLLVGVDNRLLLFEGGDVRVVLEARFGNFFWHGVTVGNRFFVQEYGEPPTGIYVSEDLVHWVKVVDNVSIDRSSKHFHYVGSDPYRGWLIATLGDGNVVRAIYSPDFGKSWKPLYVGPWQFMPFVARRDRIVFGFDSGITKGGVGVYHPGGTWDFKFFKPAGLYDRIQFAELLYVDDLDVFVAAFGFPQALAVSRDLVRWHPILVEGSSADYSHHVGVLRAGDRIIGWTGRSLVSVALSELSKFLESRPLTSPYRAYVDRIRGSLFMVKRRLWSRY